MTQVTLILIWIILGIMLCTGEVTFKWNKKEINWIKPFLYPFIILFAPLIFIVMLYKSIE